MPFSLVRTSADAIDLALSREHEKIVAPRKGSVDFAAFRASDYSAEDCARAAEAWDVRALQEFHSLALFTQISMQLHLLGAPLDWSGAFARMIEDEVRHTDLCLRMCDALGHPSSPRVNENELHLVSDAPLRAHVRDAVVAAFCIGETVSGLMFKRALRAATVPLARDVVAAIVVDETFHGELGWELLALLMRDIELSERELLRARVPFLFSHYAKLCCATRAPAWTREQPAVDPAPNFGTLTREGYGRAFFDAMEEYVVPGLVACGIEEAEPAYAALVASLS